MSAEARYFRVGVFVFVGMLAIGSCAVILGGQNLLAEKVAFETYFGESVQGLEVGSPVKLRGVKLGAVKAIGLVDDFYPLTEAQRDRWGELILVRIEATAADLPAGEVSMEERRRRLERNVERGLRLRLAQSGITGVAFVEADVLDPERHPPMEIGWEPEVLYVPSTPSTLAAITSAVERVMQRLEDAEIEKLVEDVDRLVTNLADATDDLELGGVQREAEALLVDLRTTATAFRTDLEEADVPALSASARSALDEANATLVRTRRMIDGGRYDLELALENLRVTTENLRDLTETLKGQPSLLVRGQAPERTKLEAGAPEASP